LLEKVKKLRTLYFNQLDYFLESFFMAKKNKGFFMVLEGIDGSGTSTHTRKVSNWIRKLEVDEVVQTSEPTKGMIGRLIKERLKEGGEGRANNIEEAVIDALLFAADRLEHVKKEILLALNEGKIVVCTRYIESSIVYQTAQGLDTNFIEKINKYVIIPDLVIILDISPEIALKRAIRKRWEKFENTLFLTKVRELYKKRAKEKGYPLINSNRNIKEVEKDIQKIVLKHLTEKLKIQIETKKQK